MEALAAPLPFKAGARAALGHRLLNTLRGLRGADAELPVGWRDDVVSLPRSDDEEDEEEEDEEDDDEEEYESSVAEEEF